MKIVCIKRQANGAAARDVLFVMEDERAALLPARPVAGVELRVHEAHAQRLEERAGAEGAQVPLERRHEARVHGGLQPYRPVRCPRRVKHRYPRDREPKLRHLSRSFENNLYNSSGAEDRSKLAFRRHTYPVS